MLLETTIKPRRDGTVIVTGEDGAVFVFRKDGKTGPLTCDVTDDVTVAKLLRLETFTPVNEADFDAATKLVGGEGGDDDGDEDGEDGDDEDPVDPNAPPEEANTPPRPTRTPRAKRAAAA